MPRQGHKNITIHEEIYDDVATQAKRENRSVANMAETLLSEGISKRGKKR